jgi:hypothetical protein
MVGEGVRASGPHCPPPIVITRSRKWVPPGLYNLMENPPKSPFFKGGLSKGFYKVPPFDKGGVGGISIRGQVKAVIYSMLRLIIIWEARNRS